MRNPLEGYGSLQTVDDYDFEFNEGRQAFLDGEKSTDCPYAEAPNYGNRSRGAWVAGYYAAFQAKHGKEAAKMDWLTSGLASGKVPPKLTNA